MTNFVLILFVSSKTYEKKLELWYFSIFPSKNWFLKQILLIKHQLLKDPPIHSLANLWTAPKLIEVWYQNFQV